MTARNQILRHRGGVRTMTTTEASRKYSDLLDGIEQGETITVARGNRTVAEIGAAHRRTGADLRSALAGIPAPDDEFARDVSEALDQEAGNPWADA